MLLTRVANWKNTFLLQGEKNVVYVWEGCLNSRDSPFLELNSLASNPKMEEQKQGSAGNPKYVDKTDYGTVNMEHQLDATITVLLISKISSTCFGQTFAHLQERKT
jgi:hypothetical protein